jgi:hypothetical protein
VEIYRIAVSEHIAVGSAEESFIIKNIRTGQWQGTGKEGSY